MDENALDAPDALPYFFPARTDPRVYHRPAASKPKPARERLYKQVTRRTAQRAGLRSGLI